MRKPNVELLCDSHHGVYIPQIMIHRLKDNGWRNIPLNAVEVLSHPDNEDYWDTWNQVLDNAEWHDEYTTQVFKLHHDGDLWAYCEASMSPTEYHNMFGEYPEWFNEELEEA
ncbi:hypothetical protein pEaSNUABM50_00031 [Erwinia phage pEa_SNUABM_50]|uniref:Uncharacterized protein n=4 Tax=Eneladusvirus BF TaxID=2560751 RepID=A0A7L8ZM20_9CAUD|nr:hypothetical protein FDH34_gp033 [Serratia phage BF]QOI70971.1 hypothetical protein pEaSNUABM12_00033 [Erwinia phage pEa_SNUABM_12]QOI71516.1 hypothetical protein pEaSNUABM47_00032 [Erwinia phage pEa_SNUABM_47]QOI72055.1 hypothetical protein pEaSNUABM50_00031 [Erwinia phage pEa_SNUABM_50]QXO11180.1 hypothetical protein pEaSNUABM19_00034 [Erwinia phage pEa_SNUABM_19]QXO11728.1 hypothetical protein pEaSNUABM44_00032 [Erwinia phage pEa_SNUABM_44]QXO12279.1 hypothetical protein pEaSNUABM49_000